MCAGETSGDLNGAFLVAELAKLRNDLHFWGAGGARLREAGVDVTVDMTGGGTIGIAETLRSLPGMVAKYHRLRAQMLRRRPDLFIPIDFGAFNVRLAQIARANGIPVVYYFPPSSWRRRPRNASKLIACGGKVITPFPWSAELLKAGGVDARFVGHPLLDIAKPSADRATFFRDLDLDEALPTIGLLPGSREHELREHMPAMMGCAVLMHRELEGAQFVVGAAHGADRLREQIAQAGRVVDGFPEVRVVEGRTYDCMAHCDFLISKSGTATLEAAILGTPMVIIYKGSAIMRFEYLFRKAVLEDFIGMPNIVANRLVCPEIIGEDVTPEKLCEAALGILKDEPRLSAMSEDLAQVKRELGEPGAVARAAECVLEMAGLPPRQT